MCLECSGKIREVPAAGAGCEGVREADAAVRAIAGLTWRFRRLLGRCKSVGFDAEWSGELLQAF